MISFENTEVFGWQSAIRGMRNPMNSWDKSDSCKCDSEECSRIELFGMESDPAKECNSHDCGFCIGENDLKLMKSLVKAGTDHSKFMRMINVTVDITAPRYWWTEFDTYKVGTVRNSCSTMHKIHDKKFTIDDFSFEHMGVIAYNRLENIVKDLNMYRQLYRDTGDKMTWWSMIQLLPQSYNQRATVQLNYQVLRNIYHSERKHHKLDEWRIGFMEWIENLPYSELITGTVSRTETVAKNATATDDDHSCATCEWYTDGRCLKDCENHEWYDYCLNHKPKAATTNDHFRDAAKKIDLVEE